MIRQTRPVRRHGSCPTFLWFACGGLLLAQANATAQPVTSPVANSPAATEAAAPADAARKAKLLASERWRRALFEFDQWLVRQPVYTPAQVRKIKADLAARIDSMSSFDLDYLLDTLEAKLAVLSSPETEDARTWLGRYLAVMADRKREEVLGEVPNILDMSSTELEAAVHRIEAKRTAVEQQHRRTLVTRDTTAALVEANREQQEAQRAALAVSRPAAEVYSPYRDGPVPEPPFSGTYESPTVVGVGPWGSFLLIPTVAF
jgi:hypothetical protein